MTDRALLQQALEALERYGGVDQRACDAEEALRERLAQPEQEPVAHCRALPPRGDQSFRTVEVKWVPLYADSQPRQWRGLTGDEISECWGTGNVVAAVEAKLREKNGGEV